MKNFAEENCRQTEMTVDAAIVGVTDVKNALEHAF